MSDVTRSGVTALGQSRSSDGADSVIVFNDENNIDDMYLTFGVAGEEYAVGIVYVTEIVGMQKLMPVPDVPHYIKGVINLRGKVIPLMDVRSRFGMADEAYSERTVTIVLDVDTVPVGLIVDDVRDVLEILPSQIDPAPPFGSAREKQGLIRGLGKSGELVAIILDIRRLVDEDGAAAAETSGMLQ